MRPSVLVLCAATALTVAGCTTSKQGSAGKEDFVKTTRAVVGTSLIGARGETPRDQDKIDDTVAGICAVRAFTPAECERHSKETQAKK
jgi:hypothetical protein